MTTKTILSTIDRKKVNLISAIPKTYRAALHWESLRQGIAMAVSRSEKLQQCTPQSVYSSVLDILRFGLDPSGGTGQAYLVPYYSKSDRSYVCQAIIGQQGKIELAFRTGKYASIVTEVIRENDRYSFDLARRHLTHDYDPTQPRGDMLLAYCRIWLTTADQNGPPSFQEIMPLSDFEKIKRGKVSAAYKEWAGEMFRRSVLSRCLKRAPKSIDLAEVLSRESELVARERSGIVVDSSAPLEAEAEPVATYEEPAPREIAEQLGDPEASIPAREALRAQSTGGDLGGMP